MNRNQIIIISCVLTLVFIFHGYFYYHHLIRVKESSYSGWDLSAKGNQVQIKEIRLVNKSRKVNYEPNIRFILLPMYQLDFIPVKVKNLLTKLMLFYTLPYQDQYYLEVSGVYLAQNSKELSEGPDLKLVADGVHLSNKGVTTMWWEEGNIRFFSIKTKDVSPNIKTLDITWLWNAENGEKVLNPNFIEKTYNYFEEKPEAFNNFNPEKIVSDFLWSYYRGDGLSNSLSTLVSVIELDSKLKWVKNYKDMSSTVNTVYLEQSKDHKGTFAVTMGFYFPHEKLMNEQKPDATQTFYLSEIEGAWKIRNIEAMVRN